MMTDAVALKDLTDALDNLTQSGWMRGAMLDIATGRCCIVGAFGWPWPTDSPGIAYLAAAARAFPGWKPPKDINDLAVVIRFNDYPGRTFEQVKDLFGMAIAAAALSAPCTV